MIKSRPNFRYELKAAIFNSKHKSMKEFAEKIKAHPVNVSRIISGHGLPSLELAWKMAEALDITLERFKELLQQQYS